MVVPTDMSDVADDIVPVFFILWKQKREEKT